MQINWPKPKLVSTLLDDVFSTLSDVSNICFACLSCNNLAAIATVEASASRKAYQYRYELEAAKEAEKEIRHKLDEALSTSRSVQSTLASVVAEKERMIAENVEMKAVCEELMAMVEGGSN